MRNPKKKHLFAAGLVLLGASGTLMAQPMPANYGYWVDSNGRVAKNSWGECWRSSYWTPALAIAECDPDLVPKSAPAPVAAPAPAPVAVAPPPPPPPAAAPAPAPAVPPVDTYRTQIIEKPVRLEGAKADDMLATIQKGEAAARRDLRMQLLCERLTNTSQEDGYVNAAMTRGMKGFGCPVCGGSMRRWVGGGRYSRIATTRRRSRRRRRTWSWAFIT